MMTSSNDTFNFISTEYSTHKQYNQIGEAYLCAVRETVTATQQAFDLMRKFWRGRNPWMEEVYVQGRYLLTHPGS